MKILILLILVLFLDRVFAQDLTGYVFDEDTGKPIPSATVRAGLQIVITTESGYFNLKSTNAGDTITFSHISYKPYYFISSAETSMNVFIKINTTVLNSVVSKDIIFHLARHTYATKVTLSNGMPIETSSMMLGHTNIATTELYAKVLEKKISEDMAALKKRLDDCL